MKISSRLLMAVSALVFACSGGCNRFSALNAVVPTCGYSRTADLIYGPLQRQKLDVYRPTENRPPGKDVVVFFYGGDWQNGSKAEYRFVAQALASHGYLTVMPDYRLYPDVQFPEFVRDGALAVKWAHDNASSFGGNPDRLFVMGHSAGAHIAAMLTIDPEYLVAVGSDRSIIRATAGLSGPYDFVPPPADAGAFGMTTTNDQKQASFEPIDFVDGKEPPMLLITGMKDATVNPDNTTHLADKIREHGGAVQVKKYPAKGHVAVVLAFAFPFRWLAPTLRDVTDYFRSR